MSIEKKVKSEIIARKLETMIIEGSLKEGQKLPPERVLCKTLAMSRNCLREALKELNARGILETKQGSGTRVALFKVSKTNRSIVDLLAKDEKTLKDLLYMRRLLESEATALAAKNATEMDKEKITKAFKELVELSPYQNTAKFAEKDIAFHRSIYIAANNQVLLLALNSVRELMGNWFIEAAKKLYPNNLNSKVLINQHKKIYNAILEGNAQSAKQAARAHIDAVKTYLKIE